VDGKGSRNYVPNSAFKDMTMPEALNETFVEFPDNRLLIELCGQFDRNLAAFEQGFGVVIMRRGNRLALHGPGDQRERATSGLEVLYRRLESGRL
jgi:phosphate starvation-inducible PhoH-like protein